MYKSGSSEEWMGIIQRSPNRINFILKNSWIQEKRIDLLPLLQKKRLGRYTAIKSPNIYEFKKICPRRGTEDLQKNWWCKNPSIPIPIIRISEYHLVASKSFTETTRAYKHIFLQSIVTLNSIRDFSISLQSLPLIRNNPGIKVHSKCTE